VNVGKPYVLSSDPSIDPVSGRPLLDDERAWFGVTDSVGRARLVGFPEGERYVHVCSELYGHAWARVITAPGRIDTLRLRLRYLGEGREHRCETRFDFDGVNVDDPGRRPTRTP